MKKVIIDIEALINDMKSRKLGDGSEYAEGCNGILNHYISEFEEIVKESKEAIKEVVRRKRHET